jgi:hypothetical protein
MPDVIRNVRSRIKLDRKRMLGSGPAVKRPGSVQIDVQPAASVTGTGSPRPEVDIFRDTGDVLVGNLLVGRLRPVL